MKKMKPQLPIRYPHKDRFPRRRKKPTRPPMVIMLLRDIPRSERDAFKKWCRERGYSMVGLIRSFIKQAGENKIDCNRMGISNRKLKPLPRKTMNWRKPK